MKYDQVIISWLNQGQSPYLIIILLVWGHDPDLMGLNRVMSPCRLLVVDGGWKTCGVAAEISAMVSENGFEYLKAPIKRLTLPDCLAPASAELEKEFYKYSGDVVEAVKEMMT